MQRHLIWVSWDFSERQTCLRFLRWLGQWQKHYKISKLLCDILKSCLLFRLQGRKRWSVWVQLKQKCWPTTGVGRLQPVLPCGFGSKILLQVAPSFCVPSVVKLQCWPNETLDVPFGWLDVKCKTIENGIPKAESSENQWQSLSQCASAIFQTFNVGQALTDLGVMSVSFSYYFPLTTYFQYHNFCNLKRLPLLLQILQTLIPPPPQQTLPLPPKLPPPLRLPPQPTRTTSTTTVTATLLLVHLPLLFSSHHHKKLQTAIVCFCCRPL